jgi:CBS domain containing-hemolysin-like protein
VIRLAIAALFILLNGFFVAAEFALVKLRATQLHAKVREGDRRAILAHQVISRLDRYLGVTQLGVTLASLGLGWIGEPAITRVFEDAGVSLTGHALGEYSHFAVVAAAFFLLTSLHVLFGELVPKLVAIQRSERTALFVAVPVRVIYIAFRPLLWVLEAATRVILRAMGLSADVGDQGALPEGEILGILAASTRRSPRGREKSELVERVIRFSQRTARQAMVPRVDVASLPLCTRGEDAALFLRKQQFSRVILTKERSLDEVAGYLYAKDFWLDPTVEEAPDLSKVRRDVLFVPETQGAVDVLRNMQREETPIAVVVDEYGGTSGIVTMEDLLEEIVGEIKDELDEEPAKIMKVEGERAAWDVDGRARMEELRSLGMHVDEADAAEPVGAVVLGRLGRLPRARDKVEIGNATAEVIAVNRRRVVRVRIWLPKTDPLLPP